VDRHSDPQHRTQAPLVAGKRAGRRELTSAAPSSIISHRSQAPSAVAISHTPKYLQGLCIVRVDQGHGRYGWKRTCLFTAIIAEMIEGEMRLHRRL
jgi:hypothetical protein